MNNTVYVLVPYSEVTSNILYMLMATPVWLFLSFVLRNRIVTRNITITPVVYVYYWEDCSVLQFLFYYILH